jgi:NitT/TauT family transport system ATP-binding protein
MDEPFSSLDAFTREGMQELVAELQRQQGFTSVIVTHDVTEAVFLGKRILVLTGTPVRGGVVIDNPQAGERAYRHDPAFYARCSEVKDLIEPSIEAAKTQGTPA